MLDFRILGPLEVRTSHGPLAIGGRHHPRLLAVLLDEANRTVPTDRLVAALWEGRPPTTAVRQVQNIAVALRSRLGPAGDRLEKSDSGYLMRVEDHELDTLRCERSAAEARRLRASGRLVEAEAALGDALAEWRGPSLAGFTGRELELAARRLDDLRLALTEERIDIGLELGRHASLLSGLQRLRTEHPHRQRLAEQHMLALYRCGRGPEALRVFAEVRDCLADELGTDPGKSLRDLHTAVLREDPALDLATDHALDPALEPAPDPAPAPVTLPTGTAAFTGRGDALTALDESVQAGATPFVILAGPGGIGKTVLALHWAHGAAREFPGGRLYIDLRGFAPNAAAMTPTEAVRQLLGALGVESRRIPADVDAQISLYRTVVGSERRLLILDNAQDAAQVRPLLPNSPQVHTVVISRSRLVGLAASHGARIIELGTFTPGEAADLLRRQLGDERPGAEPASVDRILAACAGLPLALAITAARAATRPDHPLAAIADELETTRLDALAGDEDAADLRAVFSWSYRALDPDTARLFRRLALTPGPDFGPDSVLPLVGGAPCEASNALRRLVDAHLVEHGRPGRYRLHDLVRLYAAELLDCEEPQPDRDAAATRLLDWYLSCAHACRSLLCPEEVGLPRPADAAAAPITTTAEAAEWLKAEWSNLVAAVEFAARDGKPATAWRLADMLRGHVWRGMLGSDGLRLGRAALAAAEAAGDVPGLAAAELVMACALIRSNRTGESTAHGLAAAAHARLCGWTAGAAAAEFNLGAGAFYLGRMREGLRHLDAALRDNRAVGERHAECVNLHWLGILHSLLGDLEPGVAYFHQALEVADEIGADSVKPVVLIHLAEIELFRGRPEAAAARLAAAAELERSGPGYDKSGDLQGATARLRLAEGDVAAALELAEHVVDTRTDAADHRIRTHAMVTLAAARDAAGEYDAAIAVYDRALAMTEQDATAFHRVEALIGRAGALLRSGRPEPARAAAARALDAAEAGEYRFLEAQAHNQIAAIELAQGRPSSAAASAWRALELCKETGHRPAEAAAHRILAAAESR
ncbi:AfsR/SARP family transcriptional regulator [Glycomyces terrestris]|uniref:Transcriptional regulator n=1 Tax=Glycomyces terrestris TaxID=2493553 RepID=A0A426V4C0_9ACTN|nr:BTAD domain-containing putative transcriptional regulator [Glycomyces terrestris]RRS01726.1 transcriptional regulator [Glycomyces terrestris]